MRLDHKVSIITGAASGVGRAATLLFAREGSRVVAADIEEDGLRQTEALVVEAGGEVLATVTDVSRSTDVQAMVRAAADRFGAIDILYNNAGRLHADDGFLCEIEDDVWDETVATNLKSVYLTCKYAIPVMLETGGGTIINTSSMSAFTAGVGTAYGASKGAIVALTRNIAKHYAPAIRANCLVPGGIATNFSAANRASGEAGNPKPAMSGKQAPIGRAGHPDEIAKAALFLASDDSSFIDGSNFTVDGGILAV